LAKKIGEFLVRIEPQEAIGHSLLVALLLPIKAFFWRSAKSKAVDEYHNDGKSPTVGLK